MESKWNDNEADACKGDLLNLRVYTSRLLGIDSDLVMHGGGNTSVKISETNLFGQEEQILYVKGSGWDLATIEAPGFAPVKMNTLMEMAKLQTMTDLDMVKYQRAAMTDPSAPNPSVEAVLHAIIPYTFVDHTHADAVVTLTNTPDGEVRIKEIYGDKILIIPYVMPGFILARKIFEMTQGIDWDKLDGMILLNHGVFTFHSDPRVSYEKMIQIVSKAEAYINKLATHFLPEMNGQFDSMYVARIRKHVSEIIGRPILAETNSSREAVGYSAIPDIESISSRGPITPDHIIRTKRKPVIIGENPEKDIEQFGKDYKAYFNQHSVEETMLDQAPKWAIKPGAGEIYFGPSPKHTLIIKDIAAHTRKAIHKAEQLGGWLPLEQSDLFEMEYWSLEQAKLSKAGKSKEMGGKIALVTGAASGIGKACVEELVAAGAVVGALDISASVLEVFESREVLPLVCDMTDSSQVKSAIEQLVCRFGGLDLIVSNAGIFPKSTKIEDMSANVWDTSLALNLTSHQRLIQLCQPYLEMGFGASIVLLGSKNVPAPGPGASAYSVAKAGLTQLGRVAALELGPKNIRVNIIHPNAVYDTGIWTEEILEARAQNYGLTVKEYKTNNVLKTEVTSLDVARLAVDMLGDTFSKVTGAQIPIDGGNERVI